MQLWEMSISGGVLIVVILVLRRLFQNKVPKRTFLVLWTVAVVRLLVPVAVDAPWNLHSWLEQIGVTARLGELAELVGVRRETIMRLEKAQYNPSLKLAVDISRAVGAPIEEIFLFE